MATSLGFSLGTKIAGKYEILDTLGVGGMGVVYKVREQVGAVGRIRALKTILPQHVQNQDMRNRFREEAEKMCVLEHENIVPVLNYSEEGDLPFIVMPFIEGHTLKDYLSRHLKDNGTGLPLPQVLEIGVQVALGLEIALWVKDYCGAFERRDVDRLASLGQYKTKDDQEAARKALDKLGDLRVACSQPSISLAGTQATVAFDRTDTVTDPSGQRRELRLPPFRKEIERTPEGLHFTTAGEER